MNNQAAPRSIDAYLNQLRAALEGEDPALVQDALYDAEEYLRAEVASHTGKAEADVLELIASTYGAPDEVAAAYRDTEAKVKAALHTPRPTPSRTGLRRFFDVWKDPRAYSSLFFLLLSIATGVLYFTLAVTGMSVSAGLAILIIGVPFFLIFIGIVRAMALGEGRLLEAITGERMPRRPVHPGPRQSFWARVGEMLRDARTWTTLAYFVLMLPLGIAYFTFAVAGLSVSLSFLAAPVVTLLASLGVGEALVDGGIHISPGWLESPWLQPLWALIGVLLLTALLHAARGLARVHSRFAKTMLVARSAAGLI